MKNITIGIIGSNLNQYKIFDKFKQQNDTARYSTSLDTLYTDKYVAFQRMALAVV